MAFVKVLKNKAFFKRFQVKKRRRLQGKTDFFARKKMIAYATIAGDMVVAHASSQELDKYGVKAGLKNYAAAYCTGLLVARRALKKFGLDQAIKGKEEINGEEFHVEDEENDQRPFKCILDVGLRRTCVGARMWGALKGAVDGGLHVPHNTKNFPGFKAPEDRGGEGEYDAEAHKERIFGGHVKEYMEMLSEEDPTKYEAHFAKFISNDMEADKLEDIYSEAHKKIKADPEHTPKEKKSITHERKGNKVVASDGTDCVRSVKLSLKQRREKVQLKIAAAQAKMMEE